MVLVFKTAVDSFGLISPFARFRIDYYPTTPSLPLTLHALTGQQSSSQTFHITSVWRVNFPFFFFCFLLLWRYTKVKVRIIFLSGKTQWASLGEKKQMQKYATGYYDGPMHDQDAPAECKSKNMPHTITTNDKDAPAESKSKNIPQAGSQCHFESPKTLV